MKNFKYVFALMLLALQGMTHTHFEHTWRLRSTHEVPSARPCDFLVVPVASGNFVALANLLVSSCSRGLSLEPNIAVFSKLDGS